MTTPSTSPYVNAAAVQTAVLQPPATPANQPTAAARRSFRSFVEAMDDFGGDRRDVAGMRQMLAMQEENQRVAAAKPAVPVARSFAPDQAQPEVPVVRGPVRGANLPQPNAANVVPGLPAPPPPASIVQSALPQANSNAVQVSALPRLPTAATESGAPMLVIDPAKINPAPGPSPWSARPPSASSATCRCSRIRRPRRRFRPTRACRGNCAARWSTRCARPRAPARGPA